MSKSSEGVHIVDYGSGPEIWVGLHGWNGTARTFDAIAPYIPENVTFLSVDLPGYGRSEAPPVWDISEIGAQIDRAIVERIGEQSYSMIGSCGGAIVGLYVARAAGERLDDFVCLEPFAFLPWYLRIFMWPVLGWLFYWSSFGTPIGRAITNQAMAKHRNDETDMLASFGQGSLMIPYRYLQLFNTIEASYLFKELPGHKILVSGEHTFGAIRESVKEWNEVWPTADHIEIPGAGHLVLLEAPELFAEKLFERRAAKTPRLLPSHEQAS